jgi:hypothetical protein
VILPGERLRVVRRNMDSMSSFLSVSGLFTCLVVPIEQWVIFSINSGQLELVSSAIFESIIIV